MSCVACRRENLFLHVYWEYHERMRDGWWTTPELLVAAHEQGFTDLTARRIETWRHQGLLPRPQRVAQNGVRPVWLSPPETAPQLHTLCELHQQTQNTGNLRLLLWLRSYSQPPAAIRSALVAAIDDAHRTIETELAKTTRREQLTGDPTDVQRQAMTHLAARVAARRGANATPPRVRSAQPHRSQGIAALLHTMFFGEVPPPSHGTANNVERTLGLLPRGRIDTVTTDGPGGKRVVADPWHDGTPTPLDVLADVASLPALRRAAEQVSDADLELARTITAPLISGLGHVAQVATALRNYDQALGLGLVATIKFEGHEAPLLALVASLLQSEHRNKLLALSTATQIAMDQAAALIAVIRSVRQGVRLRGRVDRQVLAQLERVAKAIRPDVAKATAPEANQ